jgi:Coenzyme PQQ synthesis protein D (PqqD)
MPTIEPNHVPRPTIDAAWKDVAGEMVVVDVRGGIVRGLNTTGGQVWALLDGHRTAGEIAAAVAEFFQQPPSAVLADVLEFLSRMKQLGMIEV